MGTIPDKINVMQRVGGVSGPHQFDGCTSLTAGIDNRQTTGTGFKSGATGAQRHDGFLGNNTIGAVIKPKKCRVAKGKMIMGVGPIGLFM